MTKPNRHNIALIFIPLCFAWAARVAGRHATTPTFSFTKCLVWLCLSFPARSLSIGKTYQREQTSILCCRERERSSPRKTGSQEDLRHYLVFQLFGSGKSTLGVIVSVHSGGSSLICFVQTGRHTPLTPAITPTPSENIIDLDIKRAVRLKIKFHACLILHRGFWRPDTFFPVQASVTSWTVSAVTTS